MKINRIKNSNNRLIITAIELVAEMFEYAKSYYRMNCDRFFELFNETYISDSIYNLNIICVYGKSSIELVDDIIKTIDVKTHNHHSKSLVRAPKHYWLGLIIASYCIGKRISFKEFEKKVNLVDLLNMYDIMHEAAQLRMIDEIDNIIRRQEPCLAQIRKSKGMSQKELSILSNVSLRSIQMYEQRQKSISKASFETVRNLARALAINIDDLYDSSDIDNKNVVIMY